VNWCTGSLSIQTLKGRFSSERKGYLDQKLQLFADYFAPKTIGEFNGHYMMLTKLKGQFIWRKHDDTDDFFLVLLGTLGIELRDCTVTLGPGEMYIVPKGVEHHPVAREEVHVLLIEPSGTDVVRRRSRGSFIALRNTSTRRIRIKPSRFGVIPLWL